MKFFIAIALIATVASAAVIKPTPVSQEMAEIGQIIAAIQSPSTDPATAVALEAMLAAALGLSPISVGPAIVEQSPISVGPAIIDFPMPDGGAVTAVEPTPVPSPVIVPSPVVIGEIPAGATPLVQIIVNVDAGQQESGIAPAPVDAGVIAPGPVNVVDHVVSPVDVVEPVAPGPVNVVDNIVVSPVQVAVPVVPGPVNVVDHVVSPVIVGTPIIPAPVVVLPETLN